jgi:Domain of unknown function (DUF4234)
MSTEESDAAAQEPTTPEAAPAEPSPAEPAPAAAGGNTGELGQERGVAFVIVVSIVTLGIYTFYWLYKTFSEVKRHSGEGFGGIVGILLCIVVVGYFFLPQAIGRMYAAEGNENPPVSGLTGLWIFLPYVGGFIWLAKIQGALNAYWRAKGTGTVAALPASTGSF